MTCTPTPVIRRALQDGGADGTRRFRRHQRDTEGEAFRCVAVVTVVGGDPAMPGGGGRRPNRATTFATLPALRATSPPLSV